MTIYRFVVRFNQPDPRSHETLMMPVIGFKVTQLFCAGGMMLKNIDFLTFLIKALERVINKLFKDLPKSVKPWFLALMLGAFIAEVFFVTLVVSVILILTYVR